MNQTLNKLRNAAFSNARPIKTEDSLPECFSGSNSSKEPKISTVLYAQRKWHS